jgi:CheY-like chemotaxis protein
MLDEWNLLIVEDEADSVEVIARILHYHKIRHCFATTAEEAMSSIAQEQPTGLIVDLALPGRDGWWLIQQIRGNPDTAHIRVVASTAFHSISVAHEAITAGFDAYLPKPIEATRLVQDLEKIFAPAG